MGVKKCTFFGLRNCFLLTFKYPTWLREKKASLSSDVHENYSKQYELVCEICMEYESEKEKDTEDVKKKRFDHLMVLMQQVCYFH